MTMKRNAIILMLTLVGGMLAAQTSSPLASGRWWRVEVHTTGVHRITASELPALQGATVSAIGMYGSDARILTTANSSLPDDALLPMPIEVVDRNGNGTFDGQDEVLFFAEGAGVWRFAASDQRWEYRQHPYTNANYCYLTIDDAAPARLATATIAAADTTVAHYTAVARHENDITNMFSTGQIWVGEKFNTTLPSRSFTLSLPQGATAPRLRYALASVANVACSFRIRSTGFDQSHTILSSAVYTTILESMASASTSMTFDVTYTPGESTAIGYIDYIELNASAPLTFGGGQTMIRCEQGIGHNVQYRYGGSGTPRVWDVSRQGDVRELNVSGGAWTDSVHSAKCFVLFDGTSYLTPTSIAPIANQDLHGMDAADYIVVCHPDLLPQGERLATLHAIVDGMDAVAITDMQIYNEFSSGKQDPMAIRAFLRHLCAAHPDHRPQYMVLLGKPSYDPRDLMGLAADNGITTLVTYQSPNSFDDDGGSICSDDIMGYLDDWENGSSSQTLDVSIGRLPARNLAEATHMVDKTEAYIMRRDLTDTTSSANGDWRNYVALLADDADPSHPGDTVFAHSSEYAAMQIKSRFPDLNIDRFYADAYHQQSGAIGSFYPDLNNALRQRINNGCLLLNYIGHGSATYIGTERYIEPSDIAAYTNRDRLPLVVTSTCSYGRHDSPTELSGAELFMLADAGAIGVVSASRKVSHVQRFNTDIIVFALDTAFAIGDAVRMAKNRTSVSISFGLTGDPAIRLSTPRNRVVVTAINDHPVTDSVSDTATVLSTVTVRGEVHGPDGELLTDFDGWVYPIVYDREMRSHTLANDNPGTEVSFMQQKSILYKGTEQVSGGQFEYTFIVPRDVAYQYDFGKLSHYARSGADDAAGSYSNILFGGFDENAEIGDARPEIRLYMGDTNFRDGGLTDANPTLIALLYDSVGINAVGTGLGHDITAILDDNPGSLIELGDMYEPDPGDNRHGTVRYTLNGLTPGTHTITFKAWNIWGNSSTADISFKVADADTMQTSALTASPNPAATDVTFHYESNNTANIATAEIEIYTATGARLASLTPTINTGSYVIGPVVWRVDSVKPGIYLARMLITTVDGERYQSTTKVAVR